MDHEPYFTQATCSVQTHMCDREPVTVSQQWRRANRAYVCTPCLETDKSALRRVLRGCSCSDCTEKRRKWGPQAREVGYP